MHRAQDHQLGIAFLGVLALEEITQNRYVTQTRHFIPDVSDAIVNQTGDYKTLSISQFKFGFRFARTQSRDGEAGNGKRICEVESADFGSHREMNIAVGHNHRREVELNAELFE